LIGLAATVILWKYAPDSFGWFVPLLAGMLVSIPLVVMTSSPLLGRVSRQDGLFLVPSETRGLRVLDRAHALAAARPRGSGADVRQLVLEDARVRELHLALLAGMPMAAADPVRLGTLLDQARRRETQGFSREDWTLLLSDSESLKSLGAAS
jgi:membrane glycosyltransferase